MRCRYVLPLCILLCELTCVPAFSQTVVGSSFMVPWIDSASSVQLALCSFSDTDTGIAIHTAFLDFPDLLPDLYSLTDMTLPLVHASISRPFGPLTLTAGIGSFSIPQLKRVIERQTLLALPETGWIFDAGAEYKSLSIYVVYGFDSARFFAGGTDVGEASVTAGALCVSWNVISLFCLTGRSQADISAHLRYSQTLGFSFEGSARGSVTVYGGAVDVSVACAGGTFSFFSCAGLLFSDTIGTSFYYAYNEDIRNGSQSVKFDADPFIALRLAYAHPLAGCWTIQLYRTLFYARPPSSTGTASVGSTGNSGSADFRIDGITRLDPVTLLFAGCGVSVQLNLP